MATIKFLGPIKKQLPKGLNTNIIELKCDDIGLTINQFLEQRNIVVERSYLYISNKNIVGDDYVIQIEDEIILMPVLYGG